MAKAEASVEELVSMIQRGELRLPEMQRRYVWRSTRVRDLMDSLYRGYPSGAILVWDTDQDVPLQEFSVKQTVNPYQSTRLLLDGQQRLTSLSAVIRGELRHGAGREEIGRSSFCSTLSTPITSSLSRKLRKMEKRRMTAMRTGNLAMKPTPLTTSFNVASIE